ncbi:carbohydrate kinase family protein [Glycomyces tritici]|uniref:Carbohydrate kinase n=1 Tax=Glycomyces tritici TaxID=2665176 RepID=A0ABT7YNL2_9ACTN|nr:carbohydrate kinase [Glycomyces tritici]MDN3239070.1 carbohydrate kinase [Glycomyces tritici]MDN3240232.1 carbohydrate kinase [Glycomyces tritici]
MAGENIIDLVPAPGGRLRPTCGGGPANTAVALARRGIPTALVGAVGGDHFGRQVWRRHIAAGVHRNWLLRTDLPSTLGLAIVHEDGTADYDYWTTGTADFTSDTRPLPKADPAQVDLIHFGSLAAYLEPTARTIEHWVNRARRAVPVSFDPNIRLSAMGDHAEVLERTERLVGLATLVRVSERDLAQLYPGTAVDQIARRWLETGPELVVVTLGNAGSVAFHRNHTTEMTAPPVDLVDSIGAGDAFTSGLIGWLTSAGWMRLDRLPAWGNQAVVTAALRYAAQVAAQACTVPGAP